MIGGNKKRMVCVDCLEKITATISQAKQHGWTVWVGGAICKTCGGREVIEQQTRAPALYALGVDPDAESI